MSDSPFRAVLLGASNLRLALPVVVGRLEAAGAREILVACGHGRSYGSCSSFLRIRRLAGILECGLWRELERVAPLPTRALLTDIGNDVIYGTPVAEIADWVEECLRRLATHRAEVTITSLALGRLEKLTPLSFRLARSVLFPGRSLSLSEVLDRIRDLDGRLRRLARAYGATLVEPDTGWYGIDPIHIRHGRRREAWEHILASWPRASPAGNRVRLPLLGAARYRLCGRELTTPQPVRRGPGGGSVSLY